ncbi:DUF6349 family protein [Nonomuraea salmonea]|uniref:DUF6349 family protein n=1 Tax=Nonomuraea salmonea TaxID=46181 RepID=A0ABV5P2W6_9ACTN
MDITMSGDDWASLMEGLDIAHDTHKARSEQQAGRAVQALAGTIDDRADYRTDDDSAAQPCTVTLDDAQIRAAADAADLAADTLRRNAARCCGEDTFCCDDCDKDGDKADTLAWLAARLRGCRIQPKAGDDCRAFVHHKLADAIERDGGDPNPASVADPGYHLRYWASCSGCGHETPLRSTENAAAEDGCDHAYPGWRNKPVMEYHPYDGKKLQKWQEAVRRVYGDAWLDRSGPVREARTGAASRHVPEFAPGGGYLMAVMCDRPAAPKPDPDPVQGALFG